MFSKLAVAVVVAAAALAATIHVAHAQSSAVYTLQLDKRSLVTALDTKPKGHSPGDLTVFSATVHSGTRVVGRLEAVTTAIDPRYQGVSFSMLLNLPGGAIVLQGGGFNGRVPGLTKEGADQLAVTGGTGRYAGAAGTATLHQTGPATQRLVLDLR
jgi:hypothetical protein